MNNQSDLQLKVVKINPYAKLPTVSFPGEDLGYDLYSTETMFVPSGSRIRVPTGIAVEFVPRVGALIRDRSSVASKGMVVVGGVIDSGWRGEILVLMVNLSHNVFTIEKGARIAQMIPMQPNTNHNIVEVKELSGTERGSNGFGSTGQ